MKSLSDIRTSFLDYFGRHGHSVLPSSSLVPHNDPTLMFANAGMNQFKNIFTGVEKTELKRAATSQKCVRAGGKHNDLDNVGYTARHHTFFEMLGNFSFGDYFKEGAIDLAWELLTKEWGINPEKLCVTVYHDDDTAWNHWKKITGFADHKIIRISTNDNFWAMGDTGPCGPCSEIFYDHGEQIAGGPPGSTGADGDRFTEIWNLVFMQFNQISELKRENLPKPSIDTGMGLERIAAVLQGVHDNYEIDLFKTLIENSKQLSENSADKTAHRVIADHLRSSCFLMADGVMPSNEGRGYVLRRIMRRAMRYAHQLGCKGPLMYRLIPALINEMGTAYPELERAQALMTETLKGEEERFKQTLERGLKLLEEESTNIPSGGMLPGTTAFKLYDTFGFPLDLTQDILRARNIGVDTEGFEKAMEGQREMARAAWSGSGEQAVGNLWFEVKQKVGATKFAGYEQGAADTQVLAIVHEGALVDRAPAGAQVQVVLDVTPFYGESGGQVGDRGWLGIHEVADTQKPIENLHVHKVTLKDALNVGDRVAAKIDVAQRDLTRANHSATHLLHKALRETLGEHVTQKGSLVTPEYLRFDFSHGKAVSAEELAKVEARVNQMIAQNTPVGCVEMKPEDAIKAGAMALFGEKYGDKVRVLSIGEESGKPYSVELCGGTHVRATGDIEGFKITREGSVAAGIRRIEAATKEGVRAHEEAMLAKQREQQLQDEQKKLAKAQADEKRRLALSDVKPTEEKIGNVVFLWKVFEDLSPKDLRDVALDFGKSSANAVALVATKAEGKASLVVHVCKGLTDKLSAVTLVQKAVEAVGGKGGGGKPDLAQGGGPEASKINNAVKAVRAQLA